MSPVPPLPPSGGDVSQADLDQSIADLVAGAPAALDTLNELSAAMGNDPAFLKQYVPSAGVGANQAVNANTQLSSADGITFVSAPVEIYLPEEAVTGFTTIVQSNGAGGISPGTPIVVKAFAEDRDVDGNPGGVEITAPFGGVILIFDGGQWYTVSQK